jgi:hypothetical protein
MTITLSDYEIILSDTEATGLCGWNRTQIKEVELMCNEGEEMFITCECCGRVIDLSKEEHDDEISVTSDIIICRNCRNAAVPIEERRRRRNNRPEKQS